MPKTRRKKSKYKSLVINKKRYYFYKITWEDILGDSGHADAIEMNQMKPAIMITHAYVFLTPIVTNSLVIFYKKFF